MLLILGSCARVLYVLMMYISVCKSRVATMMLSTEYVFAHRSCRDDVRIGNCHFTCTVYLIIMD